MIDNGSGANNTRGARKAGQAADHGVRARPWEEFRDRYTEVAEVKWLIRALHETGPDKTKGLSWSAEDIDARIASAAELVRTARTARDDADEDEDEAGAGDDDIVLD